jgi:hypothetical protein
MRLVLCKSYFSTIRGIAIYIRVVRGSGGGRVDMEEVLAAGAWAADVPAPEL